MFDAASVSTIIPAIGTKTRRKEKCSDQCVSEMTHTFVHILTRVRDITKAEFTQSLHLMIEWLKNTKFQCLKCERAALIRRGNHPQRQLCHRGDGDLL